jgi:hypothetical protein
LNEREGQDPSHAEAHKQIVAPFMVLAVRPHDDEYAAS